ncbi:inactive serine/threonine-protein kinase TEX14 isoform X5 [Haemorhous mexicanus]|uniref:inactive serine/threonine-protein kinase TEX14 isoform X5 n=1 Tax=Haemorhous mexicanus TaxID=30427 RepID=UPI0028BE0BB5|nr:inactive serine/threonine-protein kinase TEX14 isoform X5 [Haemorhous mexicanus]
MFPTFSQLRSGKKMAHPIPLPFPCPVKLGSIKGDSLEADLHEYVREGNYVKVKKLLKKGIFVDAVNSMGQTCLFTAALLGLGKIVDVLLEYGSDANHRCYDGSTPVHAAAFSGSQGILSKLLDEGGELRVHDSQGRTPQLWALTGSKESSAQMLEFMQQCTLHMQAALWNLPSDLLRKVGSSKALICSTSRFGGLVQGSAETPLGKLLKGQPSVAKNIYSFGFGKFHLAGSGHLGYLASLPIIGDRDVVQADDEPAFSYPVGPYMIMTNLMWGGSRVTVKELSFQPQQNSWKLRLADLLLAEQQHSSKLRHPHLLQLMSVCLSCDLERTRLVYERVHFGSLYSILHERRAEFPVLQTETLLHILLQILDALRFLHCRGFLHRALSSLAIQVVSSGEGKLCNLEHMVESKDSGEHSDLTRVPVPSQLFRWSSPEIILGKAGTARSDVYSFCAVLQEALTESLPWKGVEDSAVKQLILSGQQLEADVRLPLLYYDVVKSGLEPKPRNRSMKLQDIQYVLKNDLKDLVKSESGIPKAQRSAVADVNICWASAFSFQKRTVELQEKEISKAGGFSAPKDSVFPKESSAVVLQEAAASAEPPEQNRSLSVCSEPQPGASPSSESDVDGSLCSFEMNEMLASYPEGPQEFLEGGPGSGQALKDAGRQQEQEQSQWEAEEEGESSGSSTGFTGEEEEEEEEDKEEEEEVEEEEKVRESSWLSQVRGDAGRRLSSPSQSEQHISKCVLNLKIMQSMLQQAGHSLSRTEEKLDRLKALAKQRRLLQEVRMNLLPKGSSQGRHRDGSDAASQNTIQALSGVDIFLHQAVAPPSRDYIPPPTTCQALGTDSFQAAPKAAKDREAVQSEKWKSKIAGSHGDLGCSLGRGLDEVSLNQEHFLPHMSARSQKKFNLQCQRGADSHPAARREEEKWCHSKPRVEFCSQKSSEKRKVMESGWRTEVKQMARRVASGQLGLSCPCPASECTSESEAESVKEAPQEVPAGAPRSQEQQGCGWQPGEAAEPWDSEDRSDSGDSDLEPAPRTSTGRSCQSPAPDEQAESGKSLPKSSALPQQAENLSRGHSRELHCSPNSPPDVTEEFFTPDYFLPPALEGRSEPETSDAEGKAEDVCAGFLQKPPADAASAAQAPGGKILFCSTPPQGCGSNKLGVNQLSQMPGARSVADIQDLSSIPCEQNFQRGVECKTPRLSHAPTSVSTPLSSEEKFPFAFEKYKQCHEFSSDSSFCGSQETSSTVFKTFTTAWEGERSMEIPVVAPRVCPFGPKEPVGLPPVASSLRNTRQAPALSEASPPSIDELPPPAQELLDEIEHLKQQDSITPDLEGMGLPDSGVQVNALAQVKTENRESGKESEGNEKTNQSLWTKESFNLAEDTERARSSLDDVLERMLHAVPGDEEIQEEPQGHTLGAASLQDPEDAGRKNEVEERGAWAGGRAPGGCAGTSAGAFDEIKDQKSHPQQQVAPAPPFRKIVLDESSLHD